MKRTGTMIIFVLGAGFFLLAFIPRNLSVSNPANSIFFETKKLVPAALDFKSKEADDPPQSPLSNPPSIIKAVYLTGWSAGLESKIREIERLASTTEINAVVIDIKDYSGYLSYHVNLPLVREIGSDRETKIKFPNRLIRELHGKNIYVIARISIFQDPILANGKPEWALKRASGALWKDHKSLAWLDPAGEPVWDYNVSIAKDAMARGFDEVNFDYIRFPSDGDLEQIQYPYWDEKVPRHRIIRNFFKYVRKNLPDARLSADLFGLSAVDAGDLGIGQVIEDAYAVFDAVSPMVYPSHFAPGFLGYKNPAQYPYQVVRYSMEEALKKLIANGGRRMADSKLPTSSMGKQVTGSGANGLSYNDAPYAISNAPFPAKLRPWLQDFNLGADYNSLMVRAEIQATNDALCGPETKFNSSTACAHPAKFGGWMLWSSSNVYTKGALRGE